jgi:uncharacterized repeat protein (TIGR01451 family)
MFSNPLVLFRLLCVVAGATLSACAFAASPLVEAHLTVVLVQSNGQFETSGPASAAKPGDTLEYAASYNNRGNAAAGQLMPTMPIPAGTEYVPSNLIPKPTHASLDGIDFSPIPLRRKRPDADGVVREVDVPLAEYRALRWTVGTLAAGHEVVVRARVRVATPLFANR